VVLAEQARWRRTLGVARRSGDAAGAEGADAGGAVSGATQSFDVSVVGAFFPSVKNRRVVMPELEPSPVWPAASSVGAAPGFNAILRCRPSSAALAARLKAITLRLKNAIVHRDIRSLPWLGTPDWEAP
jgi:hypothetical protein